MNTDQNIWNENNIYAPAKALRLRSEVTLKVPLLADTFQDRESKIFNSLADNIRRSIDSDDQSRPTKAFLFSKARVRPA